jgi:hypothetical protein
MPAFANQGLQDVYAITSSIIAKALIVATVTAFRIKLDFGVFVIISTRVLTVEALVSAMEWTAETELAS